MPLTAYVWPQDVNLGDAGLVIMDPSNPNFPTGELEIVEAGDPLVGA